MTQTAEPQHVRMPDEVRDAARILIRDLAVVAGDAEAVWALMRAQVKDVDPETALGAVAAALIVTFTECITYPTDSGEYAEIEFPNPTDEE